MTTVQMDKVGDVLKASVEYLANRDINEPRQTCEVLMGRLLGCKPLELYVRFESRLTEKQLAAMRRGVKRLAAGEPVQYITGQVEFMGHAFKVDRRALIPRPETELLVEAVLDYSPLWQTENPCICDIGTGSGSIAISLALARKKARITAVDLSPEALELAKENAQALGVGGAMVFSGSDLADLVEPDSLDAVVANLPYMSTSDWQKLPVHIRDFEPRLALDGGQDGLSVIGEVVPDAWFVLKPGGVLFLEIGADQGARVKLLLEMADFEQVQVRKDLAGFDRIVVAIRQKDP